MWQIWLTVAGICLVIEALTTGFLIFWFAIGALLTMIVSFFTTNLIIQTSVFVLSSTILIFTTKPFVKKFVHNNNSIKTNVSSLIGKIGVVTKDIDSVKACGQVKVNGEVWSAIGSDDIKISEDTEVEIKEIIGVKVVVPPVKK